MLKVEQRCHDTNLRMDFITTSFAENAQATKEDIGEIKKTVKGMDEHLRNGMSTTIARIGSQVNIQWKFIAAGILGMMGLCATIIIKNL